MEQILVYFRGDSWPFIGWWKGEKVKCIPVRSVRAHSLMLWRQTSQIQCMRLYIWPAQCQQPWHHCCKCLHQHKPDGQPWSMNIHQGWVNTGVLWRDRWSCDSQLFPHVIFYRLTRLLRFCQVCLNTVSTAFRSCQPSVEFAQVLKEKSVIVWNFTKTSDKHLRWRWFMELCFSAFC